MNLMNKQINKKHEIRNKKEKRNLFLYLLNPNCLSRKPSQEVSPQENKKICLKRPEGLLGPAGTGGALQCLDTRPHARLCVRACVAMRSLGSCSTVVLPYSAAAHSFGLLSLIFRGFLDLDHSLKSLLSSSFLSKFENFFLK